MSLLDYPVFSQTGKYAYAQAGLAGLEKGLLSQSFFEQLKMSENLESFYRLIAETGYGKYFSGDNPVSLDEMVEGELSVLKEELFDLMPDEDEYLLNAFFKRYDYNNLKICIKSYLMGNKIDLRELSTAGVVPPDELVVFFEEGADLDELPFPVNVREIKETFEKDRQLRNSDFMLDKIYYEELLKVFIKINDSSLMDFIRQQIDLKNILIFIRLCRMKEEEASSMNMNRIILDGGYIDRDVYEKYLGDSADIILNASDFNSYSPFLKDGLHHLEQTGSFSLLESIVRSYIIEQATQLQGGIFSVKPFIGYLMGKEHEINMVKKVYIHIKNRIDFKKERDILYV